MDSVITSVHNPRILDMRRLDSPKARREAGSFLCEGTRMVEEAMLSGLCETLILREDAQDLMTLAGEKGVEILRVSERVMQSLCEAKTPQRACALCRMPEEKKPEGNRILALDGVQNPGNVGTMMRTADAAGFDGVLLGPGCADPYSGKSIAASMGSLFHFPVARTQDLPGDLSYYAAHGLQVIASELGGEDFFEALPPSPCVLVIGSEGNGISAAVSSACTCHLALPMIGQAESLNAAVAAGIMMYEIARKAEKKNGKC